MSASESARAFAALRESGTAPEDLAVWRVNGRLLDRDAFDRVFTRAGVPPVVAGFYRLLLGVGRLPCLRMRRCARRLTISIRKEWR